MSQEHPFLFTGWTVKAILAGHKTQTRRPIAMRNSLVDGHAPRQEHWAGLLWDDPGNLIDPGPSPAGSSGPYLRVAHVDGSRHRISPRVRVGDRIWGRETWRTWERPEDGEDGIIYRADGTFRVIDNTQVAADLWVEAHDNGKHGAKWRPSILMPRWVSRLNLGVLAVRPERAQDISGADVLAEGVGQPWNGLGIERAGGMTSEHERQLRGKFHAAWCDIYGAESWASNPHVWVYTFAGGNL